VVVNRRVKTDEVSGGDVAKFLSTTADAQLPFDYGTTSRCVNQGVMVADIAPGRALHRAYTELAAKLYDWNGLTPPEAKPTGLMSRLRGNSRKK
jgi:Flp pilus assembly CpaE family ATPase